MRRVFSGFLAGTLLLAAGVGGGWALAKAASNLYINGKVVSTDLIERNGKVYAPIGDVARSMNMTVVKKADGYAMMPSGGANQVEGLSGGIGDIVSNGQVLFSVTEVVRGDKYVKRFDKGEVDAGDGKEIVAVICRMKNATKNTPTVDPWGGPVTSLTDNMEHSYKAFAGAASDVRERGPNLLPGSALEFALVYEVPKGTTLKDLVYQIAMYDNSFKKSTFRISLAPK